MNGSPPYNSFQECPVPGAGVQAWLLKAAEFLRMSTKTVWAMCRNRNMPHIQISPRCYRIRPNDLNAFVNSRAR